MSKALSNNIGRSVSLSALICTYEEVCSNAQIWLFYLPFASYLFINNFRDLRNKFKNEYWTCNGKGISEYLVNASSYLFVMTSTDLGKSPRMNIEQNVMEKGLLNS